MSAEQPEELHRIDTAPVIGVSINGKEVLPRSTYFILTNGGAVGARAVLMSDYGLDPRQVSMNSRLVSLAEREKYVTEYGLTGTDGQNTLNSFVIPTPPEE